jgi:hypothetical protein
MINSMWSKLGIASFTRQQKITLLAVVVLNVLAIGGLALLVLTNQPPDVMDQVSKPDNSLQCESDFAVGLRQHNVAATVAITNQALLVYVIGPDAAAAWDVFTTTVRLQQANCGPYNLVRVDVPDPEQRPALRLILELTGLELQAWGDGRLTDAQLSERTRRNLYQAAPGITPTP